MMPPRHRLRVIAFRQLEPGVRELSLQPLDGPVHAFAPGAHLVLHLSLDEKKLANAYSLTSLPEDDHYRIAVRRAADSRGGSRFLHEQLAIGDELHAEAPFSSFVPDPMARHHLLIAGGIGITPFMSIIPALRARPVSMQLVYLSRAQQPAYEKTLRDWLGDGLETICTPQRGHPNWSARLALMPPATRIMVCGPAGLIAGVQGAARAAGWPAARVRSEAFGHVACGEAFQVQLARSQLQLAVGPTETLLQALERVGHTRASQCRSGVCGRCITPLIGGAALHHDQFLDASQRQAAIMPCVSRGMPGQTLILDL